MFSQLLTLIDQEIEVFYNNDNKQMNNILTQYTICD